MTDFLRPLHYKNENRMRSGLIYYASWWKEDSWSKQAGCIVLSFAYGTVPPPQVSSSKPRTWYRIASCKPCGIIWKGSATCFLWHHSSSQDARHWDFYGIPCFLSSVLMSQTFTALKFTVIDWIMIQAHQLNVVILSVAFFDCLLLAYSNYKYFLKNYGFTVLNWVQLFYIGCSFCYRTLYIGYSLLPVKKIPFSCIFWFFHLLAIDFFLIISRHSPPFRSSS